MNAIEGEPQLFSACADWPVHIKPGTKPKKPAKSVKPEADPVPIPTSVPGIAEKAVVTRTPAQRQWVLSLRRLSWWMLWRLWRYLGTVCHEIMVRLGVWVGFAILGAIGFLAFLTYIGVKNIDDEKPPELKPPLTAYSPNNHWKTTVTPEPQNQKPK